MLTSIAMLLLLAANPPEAPASDPPLGDQASMPRRLDPEKTEHRATRDDEPTDPWFDRPRVATDDPAFVLAAVESSRQGIIDARDAAGSLRNPELRAAAQKIGAQNEATAHRLENVAGLKGWRLPEPNPGRSSTMPSATPARANANFIVNQISWHQNTVAQFRAQLAGHGDADLKRVLREALPGYQKNLDLLLTLKP
jgi:predicted outer membrane protein